LLEENAEVVKFFCHTLLSFKPSDTENEWAANLHLCVDGGFRLNCINFKSINLLLGLCRNYIELLGNNK